jgi:2-polyprenyl-3-methyl-5-hydroxy-6-metoxy-1,4-benzoquinol methylase
LASRPACYLCGSTETELAAPNGRYAYVRCRTCGFRRQHPVPDLRDLTILYHSDYYEDRGLDKGLDEQPRFVRELIQRRVDRLTAAVGKPGRLLDVGCGTGLFLEAAVRSGWEAAGTETSDDSIAYAARFTSAKLFKGQLADLVQDVPFDAITFWDVLEHLPDPRAELGHAMERLRPGGVVGVSLPNVAGLKSRLQRGGWRYYHPSMGHISHFTPATLARLFRQAEFRVIEVGTAGAFNLWKFLGEDPLTVTESRPILAGVQRVADSTAGVLGLGETMTAYARRTGGGG